MVRRSTKAATGSPELKVAFDSSVLWADSPVDFVRADIESLVAEDRSGLAVSWLVPHAARHERQQQMIAKATELLGRFAQMVSLLDLGLDIAPESLPDRVASRVERDMKRLRIVELALDVARVDWSRLILDAIYRRPPFEPGTATEKGFRDSLVVESFVQLVEDSAASPRSCRLAFVSADSLQREAATVRLQGRANTDVLPNTDEVRNLINTLSSAASEDYINKLRPKAAALFFEPKDEETLYYKAGVWEQIERKFPAILGVLSNGATSRRISRRTIGQPTFLRKQGQRVSWKVRVQAESELLAQEQTGSYLDSIALNPSLKTDFNISPVLTSQPRILITGSKPLSNLGLPTAGSTYTFKPGELTSYLPPFMTSESKRVVGQATDIFEVTWSATVNKRGQLIKPSVDAIEHLPTPQGG